MCSGNPEEESCTIRSGESAKASWKKWLSWVLKDWWCFLGRSGVEFRRRSFQAEGALSGEKPGGFVLSKGPGQGLHGGS